MIGTDTKSIDPELLSDRRRNWSRYWASGALHSCPGSFTGNYDGTIADFWLQAFSSLGPQDRVLDIASGNGALPRLLLGLDGGHAGQARIDAIDLADIAPGWYSKLAPEQRENMKFHSGVHAEKLPFPEQLFDLVISQYGIEYADLTQAITEVLRVLKPTGRVRMIMHHKDAWPVQIAAVEIELIDWLLSDEGLFPQSAAMLPLLAKAGTNKGREQLQQDAEASRTRAQYNVCQQTLAEKLAKNPKVHVVLAEAREQLQHVLVQAQSQKLQLAISNHQRLRDSFHDTRFRLQELISHALDKDAMQIIVDWFNTRDFCSASSTPLFYQGFLMGWALSVDLGSARI